MRVATLCLPLSLDLFQIRRRVFPPLRVEMSEFSTFFHFRIAIAALFKTMMGEAALVAIWARSSHLDMLAHLCLVPSIALVRTWICTCCISKLLFVVGKRTPVSVRALEAVQHVNTRDGFPLWIDHFGSFIR